MTSAITWAQVFLFMVAKQMRDADKWRLEKHWRKPSVITNFNIFSLASDQDKPWKIYFFLKNVYTSWYIAAKISSSFFLSFFFSLSSESVSFLFFEKLKAFVKKIFYGGSFRRIIILVKKFHQWFSREAFSCSCHCRSGWIRCCARHKYKCQNSNKWMLSSVRHKGRWV